MDWEGSVVIVTGGAHGIGRAYAEAFATRGARVAILDIDTAQAERVAEPLGAIVREVDVADYPATRKAVESVERALGPVDVYCCNAGIDVAGGFDVEDGEWQRAWEVNLMSQVYAARSVLPGMLARGKGWFVVTASAAGLLTNLGAAPYSVTKHGAVALAEWLAITHGGSGVHVSCVCPEFVRTPMLDRATAGLAQSAGLEVAGWVADSAIDPAEVAAALIEGLEMGRFLILPHPHIGDYFRGKAADYDGWVQSMRELQSRMKR